MFSVPWSVSLRLELFYGVSRRPGSIPMVPSQQSGKGRHPHRRLMDRSLFLVQASFVTEATV